MSDITSNFDFSENVVEPLKVEQIPHVMPLLERCCDEMGYPFCYETITDGLTRYIQTGWVGILVDKKLGLLGIAGLMFAPHICDYCKIQAIEFLWHSDPNLSVVKGLRKYIMQILLTEMERVAKQKNLPLIISLSASKSGNFGRYIEGLEFEPVEVVYRKR